MQRPGDIACDPESPAFNGGAGEGRTCRQLATSELVLARYVGVLALGDLQYEDGAYARSSVVRRSWGRVKAITAPGSRQPRVPDVGRDRGTSATSARAAGDPAKGYYSFDLGGWHVVALNSNCAAVGGCGAGSAQERWLRADLARAASHAARSPTGTTRASRRACTAATRSVPAFWQALYDAGADVVLVGHDHDYERFAPQDANGRRDVARGLRQFVVGTGGHSLRTFPRIAPNSEARDARPSACSSSRSASDAYAWRFRPAVGTFTDAGSQSCH